MAHAAEKRRWDFAKITGILTDAVFILVGAAAISLGVNMFNSPNDIAPGGVTGTAVILSSILPLKVGTLIALMNVPLLVTGFFFLSKKTMLKTLFSVFCVSVMTDVVFAAVPPYIAAGGNGLLAAIFGGGLIGLGLGLNYIRESTTGGVDIVIKIAAKFRPHLRLGQLTLLADGLVAVLSLVVFRRLELVMLSLASAYVESHIVDALVYGGRECRFLLIFSDKSSEITAALIENKRGVTLLKAIGAYSAREQNVIAAAVHKGDYYKTRRIIRQCDPRAFVVVTNAAEVLGEGFELLE